VYRRPERARTPSQSLRRTCSSSTGRHWVRLGATGCLALLAAMPVWGSANAGAAPTHARGSMVALTPVGGRRAGLNSTISATSPNWAGYAVAGKGVTFPDVVGSWTQPAVQCPTNAATESAFWVGIDGYVKTSKTVEQIGTHADCDKAKKSKTGVPTYEAWWEMYPAPPTLIPDTVHAGDSMTAEVSAAGSSFTLTLTDNSAPAWSFSITESSSSAQQSSAEWIVESPTSKLANFGSVTFSGLTLTFAPGSAKFNEYLVDMAKKGVAKATTTPISSSSFTVTTG
jgi:Peptidase A4 family